MHPGQVTIFDSAGLPYRKHTGGPVRGVILRASPSFGESKEPRYDDVAVRCAATEARAGGTGAAAGFESSQRLCDSYTV